MLIKDSSLVLPNGVWKKSCLNKQKIKHVKAELLLLQFQIIKLWIKKNLIVAMTNHVVSHTPLCAFCRAKLCYIIVLLESMLSMQWYCFVMYITVCILSILCFSILGLKTGHRKRTHAEPCGPCVSALLVYIMQAVWTSLEIVFILK